MNVKYRMKFNKKDNPKIYMEFTDNPEIHGDATALSYWLIDDVGEFEKYLEIIDEAISGNIVQEWIGGNLYCAYLGKEYTFLQAVCTDPKEPEICSLPTTMLREIVEIWFREYKKFKEQQQNN